LYGSCFTKVRAPHARKNQILLRALEIPDRQAGRQEEHHVRGLIVVEVEECPKEEPKLVEIFAFEKPDSAAINQRDAAVAQQDDVSRVQIAMVEVVFQYLTKHGQAEPVGYLLIDVVFDQPGREPAGVRLHQLEIVGHQGALDELHDKETSGAITIEHLRDDDIVPAKGLTHSSDVGGFKSVIEFFPQDVIELPKGISPARMRPDRKHLHAPYDAPDQGQFGGDHFSYERALDFHRDPDVLASEMRLVNLSDRRCRKRRFLEGIEDL
jgi:hypothetical protein